ncbi:MAG: hypothetical protein VX520_12600, partial [Planctomycetota bacterium]|nr:hypothetical protein [Planctomycetota bacterium]
MNLGGTPLKSLIGLRDAQPHGRHYSRTSKELVSATGVAVRVKKSKQEVERMASPLRAFRKYQKQMLVFFGVLL